VHKDEGLVVGMVGALVEKTLMFDASGYETTYYGLRASVNQTGRNLEIGLGACWRLLGNPAHLWKSVPSINAVAAHTPTVSSVWGTRCAICLLLPSKGYTFQ
jgi:hypothetical protein